MPAAIDNRQRRVPIAVSRLARAVARALAAVGRPGGTVEVAVVGDAEIRRLNARYRGIGRRTDVLAFPLEAADAAGQLLGQIVVSADTARRQARRLHVPLALELDLLVTHGTLHLVGYDDRDPLEADLMHRRERAILNDAPERLWRGLLHEASQKRQYGSTTRAEPRPSRTGHPRPKPASRHPLQQPRPSRTGHPRPKPASRHPLQRSNTLSSGAPR
jgi:probable rRNA maturation factor